MSAPPMSATAGQQWVQLAKEVLELLTHELHCKEILQAMKELGQGNRQVKQQLVVAGAENVAAMVRAHLKENSQS